MRETHMFTHVMNLTMNNAIFRSGQSGSAPRSAPEARPVAAPRGKRRVTPAAAPEKRGPATLQILASAFNTAVHGG